MQTLIFLSVLLGGLNTGLLGAVIFILTRSDPNKGRDAQEIRDVGERLAELSKHLLTFEKKFEKQINETSTNSLSRLDRVAEDVGRQLKDIHDNL